MYDMCRPVQGDKHALHDSTLILICLKMPSTAALSYLQVVSRIREVPHRTRMLVVDRDTDDCLRSRGLACTEDLAIEMGTLSPLSTPRPTPTTSPINIENPLLSLKANHTSSFHAPVVESPIQMIQQDKVKRSSVTSSTATDNEVGVRIKTQDSPLGCQ